MHAHHLLHDRNNIVYQSRKWVHYKRGMIIIHKVVITWNNTILQYTYVICLEYLLLQFSTHSIRLTGVVY